MRKRITTCLALALAALCVLASNAYASVRPAAAAGCASPAAGTTTGKLPRPVLKGAVRVRKGVSSWVLEAPLGPVAGYVSQSFPASPDVSVRFRLRASSKVHTTLIRLQPGGVSLVLRAGRLKLEVVHPGRVFRARRLLTLSHGVKQVELTIDGDSGRVQLYVSGVRQGSFAGLVLAPSVLKIGSLTPAHGGSLTLTDLTASTCAGAIIPTPQAPPDSTAPGNAPPGSGCASTAAWPAQNPFAPTSFWNAPLPANAPLDSDSQAYVNELVRQVKAYGAWMNTTSDSVPVYIAAAGQPTQHVTLDTWGPDLQAEFDAVPIPCDAQPAAGSDANMVVWQPSSNRMWEFADMQQQSDGWNATWGGEMGDVWSSPGYFTHADLTNNWGATATGLPLLGGLVTQADLQRGYINHALAISLVETDKAVWSWPAQRTDGDYWTPGITPIPEGTRFRLNPDVNVASLNLPPIDKMLAQAAQTYGIVVRDKGGAVSFYGQDPKSLPDDPWPAAFGNLYVNQVLALFPWSDLEALKTQLSCCWQPVNPKSQG